VSFTKAGMSKERLPGGRGCRYRPEILKNSNFMLSSLDTSSMSSSSMRTVPPCIDNCVIGDDHRMQSETFGAPFDRRTISRNDLVVAQAVFGFYRNADQRVTRPPSPGL